MIQKKKKTLLGMESFYDFYDAHRGSSAASYYKRKVQVAFLEHMRSYQLFQKGEGYETIAYKKLFNNLDLEAELELPSIISDYFFTSELMRHHKGDEKITNIFASKSRVKHDEMIDEFVKKVNTLKYPIIQDAVFIEAFIHDLDIPGKSDNKLTDAEIELPVDILDDIQYIDAKQMELIIEYIKGVISLAQKNIKDRRIKNLLLHLTPLMIFIVANLPKNEYNSENELSKHKAVKYVISASQILFDLDLTKLNLIVVEDVQNELPMLFLLNALESQRGFKKAVDSKECDKKHFTICRALTKRNFSEETYKKRYNSEDIISVSYKENSEESVKREYINHDGDFKKLAWLFQLISNETFGQKYTDKSSPLYSINLFQNILSSCKIYHSENCEFKFNKTANLFVFNFLTKLIDAAILAEKPECYLIHFLEGLKTKKVLLGRNYEVGIDDIDETNLLFWSIQEIVKHDMQNKQKAFNLDPYEDYMESIFSKEIEPRPSISELSDPDD